MTQSTNISDLESMATTHLDTALTSLKSLPRGSCQALSADYLQRYHTDTSNVEPLRESILVDEWLLGQIELEGQEDVAGNSNDGIEKKSASDSIEAQKKQKEEEGVDPQSTRQQLHVSCTEKFILLFDNTGQVYYLHRALGNLQACHPSSGDDSPPTREVEDPLNPRPIRDIATLPEPARRRRDFLAHILSLTRVVRRKLWEATKTAKHLRKAIAATIRYLSITAPVSRYAPSSAGGGDSDRTPVRDILCNTLKWVLEMPSNIADESAGSGQIMQLMQHFGIGELTEMVFCDSSLLSDEDLTNAGVKLFVRYELIPNAPDAQRCLELGIKLFQAVADRQEGKKDDDEEGAGSGGLMHLANLNRLRGYWNKRFGKGSGGIIHIESDDKVVEMDNQILKIGVEKSAKETPGIYAHYLHNMAIKKLDNYQNNSKAQKEGSTDWQKDREEWKRQGEMLDDAIRMVREALSIGRKIIRREIENDMQPTMDTWASDLGKILLTKLQWCDESRNDSGAKALLAIAEEELKESSEQRVLKEAKHARTLTLGTLARVLYELYRGDPDERPDYLEQAIKRGKDMLEIVKGAGGYEVGRGRAEWEGRNVLSTLYLAEYERTGDLRDLQTAAKHMVKSLKSQLPHAKKLRFSSLEVLFIYLRDLNTLASILAQRYRHTGEFEDLQKAVDQQRKVVKFSAADRILKATYQVTLSEYLELLYSAGRLGSRSEEEKVLAEALHHAQNAWEVLEKYGEMHVRAACLISLSSILTTRFILDREKYAADQASAIEILKLATETADMNAIDQARLLSALSRTYGLNDAEDSHNAAAAFAAALAVGWCPKNLSYQMAEYQYRLGLEMVKNRNLYPDNLKIMQETFGKCMHTKAALPATRLKAALQACDLYREQNKWDKVYDVAKEAMDLFPLLSLRSLPQQDQQKCLESFSGFGSTAAAAALSANKPASEALELLEQGRDIIAGQRFETRTDLSELRKQHRDLAERFEALRAKLDPSGENGRVRFGRGRPELEVKDVSGKMIQAGENLQRVVKEIRGKKGFETFLEPPTVQQMTEAAGAGVIVVINMAEWRSDAFIVRKGEEITALSLPRLSQAAINKELGLKTSGDDISVTPNYLKFLWHCIARLVLAALKYTKKSPGVPLEEYPRIWWCPTGDPVRLPIHAASSPSSRVMDYVISSYTSSIKALIFSRRQSTIRGETSQERRGQRALLCSVQSTLYDAEWRIPPLENAPGEVKDIATILDAASGTTPVKALIVADPTKDNLLHFFNPPPSSPDPDYPAIFHFAGHGISDPLDPSQSCLYTTDSPLNVEELVRVKIYERAPIMAYLSACSTGVNSTGRLGAEAIHIMGAFQLAGFVGVVGSLWRVRDSTGNRVAQQIYKKLFRAPGGTEGGIQDWDKEGVLARCVHHAIISLRETEGSGDEISDRSPKNWAPFIHMGV